MCRSQQDKWPCRQKLRKRLQWKLKIRSIIETTTLSATGVSQQEAQKREGDFDVIANSNNYRILFELA